MRGGVQLNLVLLFGFIAVSFANRCFREPSTTAPRSSSDGRFQIHISGNPELYVPNVPYTVSLEGKATLHSISKYIGFTLVAESDETGSNAENAVGTFELTGDALTKYSDRCPNAVTHANTLPKSEVKVIWTAPPSGSGCIAIKATVIEHRDIWYMDDGMLTKRLCEDIQESQDSQPQIVDPCCACEEAKYEVTFEGLWSRHTHPKDFPSKGWLTRFSDVIGASHTVNYRFWEYGQMASEGLRQVAENGATRMLESELKAQSEHIRTIIKARGISYPNVTGKTFAVFRVDRKHHLVSLVSMIDPSPDWIVGVSGLELCLKDCSWVESKVLNLYPYDAGTDDGTTYISPNQPTTPREVIRRIKSTFPHDERSPFFDPSGKEIKPLAKLYLSRQRLYEKTCDTANSEENTEDSGENSGPCAVGDWGDWSTCTMTCGKGTKLRQRFYLNPQRAEKANCKRVLSERHGCSHPKHCLDPSLQTDDLPYDPKCVMTDWSDWSSCSSRCSQGTRTRSRRYVNKHAIKYCTAGVRNPPKLEQNDICMGEETDCTEEDVYEKEGCEMTQWTYWSTCSVTCGKGFKRRIRRPMYLEFNSEEKKKRSIKFKRSYYNSEEEESTYNGEHVDEISAENICSGVKMVEQVECEENIPPCDTNVEQDKTTNSPFGDLQAANSIIDATGINSGYGFDTNVDRRPFNNSVNIIEDTSKPVVDCIVSPWSPWSQCNATCGRSFKEKVRTIITYPTNGGKACPPRLLKRKRCHTVQCTGQNRPDPLTPTWGPPNYPDHIKVDCVMSKWSDWSPCNATCGISAIRIRTRSIIIPRRGRGMPCSERTEVENCGLFPCPV